MKIGNKIRKVREMRQLKQEYLAEKLNLSLNSYGKIERDEVEINFNRAGQIAAILEIKLSLLIEFDDKLIWESINRKQDTEVYTLMIKSMQDTISALLVEKQRLISIIEKALH